MGIYLRLYSIEEAMELARQLDRDQLLDVLEAVALEMHDDPIGRLVHERLERDHPERIGRATRLIDEVLVLRRQVLREEVGPEALFEVEGSARRLLAERDPVAFAVYDEIVESFTLPSIQPLGAQLRAEARNELRAIAHRYLAAIFLRREGFQPCMFELANSKCVCAGVGVAQPLMAVRTIAGSDVDLHDIVGPWLRYIQELMQYRDDHTWFTRWIAEAKLVAP